MIIDFLYTLNFFEVFLLIALFFSCFIQLYNSYLNKKWFDIYKPLNLFALLTLFYCVIGPIITSAESNGEIIYRATDHREYYQIGLFAALLSFYSFKLGFNNKNNFSIKKFGLNKIKDRELDKENVLLLHKWGELVVLAVFLMQFLAFGAYFINSIRFIGSFDQLRMQSYLIGTNYGAFFGLTVNFLIVGILLMFISLLNGSRERTKFAFYLTIATSMYINFGFRWRLVILFLPIFLIYFFFKKIKPKIYFMISLVISVLIFFGIIQLTRSYGLGLNFDSKSIEDIRENNKSIIGSSIKASFFDSNVFNTSGAMIYKTPSEHGYVGFAPLKNAILVVIPRQFLPNKPAGEYILDLYKKIYKFKQWEVGTASLGFAEYYISGGWIALLTLNFLLGYFYKRLWIWFLNNFNDPLAQINYAIYLSFLFIIYSRGYLLQICFVYLTLFTPLLICNYFWNKRLNR